MGNQTLCEIYCKNDSANDESFLEIGTSADYNDKPIDKDLMKASLNRSDSKINRIRNEINNSISSKSKARIISNKSAKENNLRTVTEQYSNFTYHGTVNDEGMKHGRGTIRDTNGIIIYDGEFRDDNFNGVGRLRLDEKHTYIGNFVDGEKHGKGKIVTFQDRYSYEGDFEDDLKHGYGIESFPNGSVYKGRFAFDKKEGKGTYEISGSSKYEGEFKNDLMNGYGKFTWDECNSYEGEWENNLMNGFGILRGNKFMYIGIFNNHKKEGIGIYIDKNKRLMVGFFKNNNANGLSIHISNGKKRIAIMKNGVLKKFIVDLNEISIVTSSSEYKELSDFYEKYTEIIN